MLNYDQYKSSEFSSWAYRDQPLPEERFLTKKFLSRDSQTLEAGTGGGCILHHLRSEGFQNLHGFDFLPAFVQVARKRDAAKKHNAANAVNFIVADASALPYDDHAFDQVIYLQQLLCMIEDADKRESAVREVARVLKPGGIGLFSFLCYESRTRQKSYRVFLAYLRAFRFLSGRAHSLQLQPWLRRADKLNPAALLDRPPFVYWYRVPEAIALLEQHGFEVIAAACDGEASKEETVPPDELLNRDLSGMLYLIARKKTDAKDG